MFCAFACECVYVCESLSLSSQWSLWNVCIPIMTQCFPAPWCPHFWLWRWCELYRVFTDPVILFCDRQNQSIKGPAPVFHIPGTSPHFRIRDHSGIQPNLINKCSSPVPQQSQMKMLLCGTEQSDKDSRAELREARLDLTDSFYIPRRRCPLLPGL